MTMKIYIDTSVINGLYAEDALWIKNASRLFFDLAKNKKYQSYFSDLVIAEIERTPSLSKRNKLLGVLNNYEFKKLNTTKRVEELAEKYIKNEIIPHKYLPDALHIALATVYKIPVIVSWNFKHIVRHKTRIMVNKINKKLKHIEIDICSPKEID